MSLYRDDRAARQAEIEALEQELEARNETLDQLREEHAALEARRDELEEEGANRLRVPPARGRLDRILATIAFVPIATSIGAAVGFFTALLLVALPVHALGKEPGTWFYPVAAGASLLGGVFATVRAVRAIWRRAP
jgi:hypothetical protein